TFVSRIGGSGPGGREHLVRLTAEKKGTRLLRPLGHDGAERFVEIGHQPAAVLKATVAVLVRSSGSLHDAVQAHERTHHQFSHTQPFLLDSTTAPPGGGPNAA